MRCGFYEKEITPPLGTTIFGYLDKRKSIGVKDKLFAKAAVLECNGSYAAFLAIDALSIPEKLDEVVKQRVIQFTEIKEDDILIAVTHSHTGIPVAYDLGGYKGIAISEDEPQLDAELDRIAIDYISLLAADAVILAYQRLQEVVVQFAEGKAENVSFIREHILKSGEIRTNPDKKDVVRAVTDPDTSLPIFYVTDKAGTPLGSITSFALHHDTVQGMELSADYSGIVAKELKMKFGNDFVSVFFSGFCGNINHYNYYQEGPFTRTTQEIGKILTECVLKAIHKAEPINGEEIQVRTEYVRIKKRELEPGFLEELKQICNNPPKGPITISNPDSMQYARSRTLLKYYDEEKENCFDVPVQVMKIGECMICALPGEIFCQFAKKLRAGFKSSKNLLIELAHTRKYSCYVPTPEMFLPFVYESHPSSARFEIAAGDKMVDKALQMAEEMF